MLTTMTAIVELGKKASTAADPGLGLEAVAALRRLLDDLELLHVSNARDQGWSWRRIAAALGVTKQTVHRKHARFTNEG